MVALTSLRNDGPAHAQPLDSSKRGRRVCLFGFPCAIRFAALLVWIVARPFMDPWFRFPVDETLITFDRIVISALLLGLLWRERKRPWREWFPHRFEWLYCGFLVLTAVNFLSLSEYPLHALRTWTDGLVLPFVIYLIARESLQTETARQKVLTALVMLSLLLGVMGISEQLFHIDWFRTGSAIRLAVDGSSWLRVNGPYRFTETLGLVSVLLFAFLLFQVRSRRSGSLSGVLLVTSLFLLALTAVFTFFRLFALLVLASLALWIVLVGGKQVRRVAATLVVIVLLVATVFAGRIAGSTLTRTESLI